MGDIKILSFNVNGINNPIKRKRILNKLKKEQGDILLLQETHLTKEQHTKLENLTTSHVFSSSYSSARRGVAIIIKKHLPFKLKKLIEDKDGRYVLVIGEIEQMELTILNVYNPPEMGPELISKLITLLATEAKGMTIEAIRRRTVYLRFDFLKIA